MVFEFREDIEKELNEIRAAGLYKDERIITSPQNSSIEASGKHLLNFCANNYLGLADNKELVEAAKTALDTWGYGLSSVRFICGTQAIHKELEKQVSEFLGTEDTILYSSCFDANSGFFQAFFTEQDAIISDQLNHASIIEGVRLSKAKRFTYLNADMQDLKVKLQEAKDAHARRIVICTDGIFSMDGIVAPLEKVVELAEEFGALVMVDDSHATGFFGPDGRGSAAFCGVLDKIDVITSTFGKALGGASGGFVSGKKEIIDYLRQKSRPYLFSNTLAPPITVGSMKALELVKKSSTARERLVDNTKHFRSEMKHAGFNIVEGVHPICPVMLGDAALAKNFADKMLNEGIYVIGFSYPVVPMGKARIRVQISAAHTRENINKCIEAFKKVGKELHVIK